MGLKGPHFATMEGINSNATADFLKSPKEAFRQWQDQFGKCLCGETIRPFICCYLMKPKDFDFITSPVGQTLFEVMPYFLV
jgi:hypothetical protein